MSSAHNSHPEVPPTGASVKVCFAGACIFEGQLEKDGLKRLKMPGTKDTSLFPGFELSGVVNAVGNEATGNLQQKSRVILYPKDHAMFEAGLTEYITVKDVNDLVKVPDELAMQVAATLPAGSLRAYSAVLNAKPFIENKLAKSKNPVVLLIVGAGAMGLLTLMLAQHCVPVEPSQLFVAVADTNLKKLAIAKEVGCSEVIHWDETIHEEYNAMRTKNGCRSGADVVIDFVSSPRSLGRSMKVLKECGVILVGGNSKHDVPLDLLQLARLNQSIIGVPQGTREQLHELINIFTKKQVRGLSVNVFPLSEAKRVFDMLGQGQINGRAVFQVCDNHSDHDATASTRSVVTKSVADVVIS